MKLAESKVTSKSQTDDKIMKSKSENIFNDLLALRKEIKFSEREIDEMIKESETNWSKIKNDD